MCAAALLVGLALLPAPALAAVPELEQGRVAYARGGFSAALALLGQAERSPDMTEEELVELYWLRGASQFRLGRNADSAVSFDALLSLRPLYAPNAADTAPDLRASLVKRAVAYQRLHGITLSNPAVRDAQMTCTLEGPGRAKAATLVVFARPAGQRFYARFSQSVADAPSVVMRDPALWQAVDGALEMVLEAQNASGVPLARLGDALHPVALTVTPQQRDAALVALQPERTVEVRVPLAPPPAVAPPAPATTPAETAPQPGSAGGNGAWKNLAAAVSLGAGGLGVALAAVSAAVAVGGWAVFMGAYTALTALNAAKRTDRAPLTAAVYAGMAAGIGLPPLSVLVALGSLALLATGAGLLALAATGS